MHLSRVRCSHFRCLNSIDFEPAPGANVIRGLNAQGKTSVLEAILFAATSKSHRTNTEAELVQRGEEGFSVVLDGMEGNRPVRIDANWWRGAKRFKVNGVARDRLSEILGHVRLVFFSPEDLGLVKEGASARRRFLDMELSQVSPPYLAALQEYRNVLRQRNELLRQDKIEDSLLDVWDVQLVRHGEIIMRERAQFVEELSRSAETAYRGIAERERLQIRYRCDVDTPEAFEGKLEAARGSDVRRQQTTRGPHRDDIEFFIDESPARSHGSQGQQRSVALAVKLAEVALIHDRTGEFPVLMLDEVLSELDDERAHRLFESIPAGVQTLITTTDLDDRRGVIGPNAKRFTIERGALREDGRA